MNINRISILFILFIVPLASATIIGTDVTFSPDNVDVNFTFIQQTTVTSITVQNTSITIDGDYFIVTPDSGHVDIEIYNFSTSGDLYKQFNASKSIQDNVSFIFSGYSSGQNVSLYLDTVLNDTITANTSGYIDFEFNITSETNITLTTTDVTAPVISNPTPLNGSSLASSTISTTLGVHTDETSECRYNTTSGQDFTNMTSFTNTDSTTHSSTISVSSGNTYNYYIKCNDTSGNINGADYYITFSVSNATAGGGGAGAGYACDETHLYYCYEKTMCEFYGGYWYDGTCNELPQIYIPTGNILNDTINEGIDYVSNITGIELENVNISYEFPTYEDLISASIDSSLIRLPVYELVDGEYKLTGYLDIRPSQIIEYGIKILPEFDGDTSDNIRSILGYELFSLPKMSFTGEYVEGEGITITFGGIILLLIIIGTIYCVSRRKDKE